MDFWANKHGHTFQCKLLTWAVWPPGWWYRCGKCTQCKISLFRRRTNIPKVDKEQKWTILHLDPVSLSHKIWGPEWKWKWCGIVETKFCDCAGWVNCSNWKYFVTMSDEWWGWRVALPCLWSQSVGDKDNLVGVQKLLWGCSSMERWDWLDLSLPVFSS